MTYLPENYAPGDVPPQHPPAAARRSSTQLGISIVLAMIALCLLGLIVTVVVGMSADEPRAPRGAPHIEEVEGEAVPLPPCSPSR
jgi:hypothetical protein